MADHVQGGFTCGVAVAGHERKGLRKLLHIKKAAPTLRVELEDSGHPCRVEVSTTTDAPIAAALSAALSLASVACGLAGGGMVTTTNPGVESANIASTPLLPGICHRRRQTTVDIHAVR